MGQYKIVIKGIIGPQRAQWFDGMRMTSDEKCNTVLTGRILDQSHLHGLLSRIRDAGLELISLNALETEETPERMMK